MAPFCPGTTSTLPLSVAPSADTLRFVSDARPVETFASNLVASATLPSALKSTFAGALARSNASAAPLGSNSGIVTLPVASSPLRDASPLTFMPSASAVRPVRWTSLGSARNVNFDCSVTLPRSFACTPFGGVTASCSSKVAIGAFATLTLPSTDGLSTSVLPDTVHCARTPAVSVVRFVTASVCALRSNTTLSAFAATSRGFALPAGRTATVRSSFFALTPPLSSIAAVALIFRSAASFATSSRNWSDTLSGTGAALPIAPAERSSLSTV